MLWINGGGPAHYVYRPARDVRRAGLVQERQRVVIRKPMIAIPKPATMFIEPQA